MLNVKRVKRILVVEDEKAYSRALILKLKNEGFDIDNASDGEEALSFLSSYKYDLVFLDLIMPKLNGFGVLEEIKNKRLNTKVVVLSNLNQVEDKEKVKNFGVETFLEKSNTSILEVVNLAKSLIKN